MNSSDSGNKILQNHFEPHSNKDLRHRLQSSPPPPPPPPAPNLSVNSTGLVCFRFLLMSTLFVVAFLVDFTSCNRLDDIYQQWLLQRDKNLLAAPLRTSQRGGDRSQERHHIEVFVDALTLLVKVDGKEVVHLYNVTRRITPTSYTTDHRGVQVVALHPFTGETMFTTHISTWQAATSHYLVRSLKTISEGRIIVLAAPGDWRYFMEPEIDAFLEEYLGTFWVGSICQGEMWVAIATVGGPLWAEGMSMKRIYARNMSTPLALEAYVPKGPKDRNCPWYKEEEHQERRQFCETYEGYAELCRCENLTIISPELAPPLEMKEIIPVVIVTTQRLYKVYRQLEQLWSQRGGNETPILLSVDGQHQEAVDFATLMKLQTVYHDNIAPPGDIIRISEHIKFSIFQTFKLFPSADKIIILEDDLLLSPDFISYFHQTAPLLDNDKTIFCINAYNYNSFVPSAIDNSRLYREDIFPAYGWMVNRELSKEILPIWPRISYHVDWDWFVRGMIVQGRSIITPEVPRTFHDGGGIGVHVKGWEQYAYYNCRPFNDDPYATVNISYLTHDAYESFLERELANATLLELTEHPCSKDYIPKTKVGSFLVYYYGETEKDDNLGYYTIAGCFGGYERGRMEHHHMMHTIGYYGNAVYLVACPGSPYCRVKDEDYEKLVYKANMTEAMVTFNTVQDRKKRPINLLLQYRMPPLSADEEMELENILVMKRFYKIQEISEEGKMFF